MTARVATVTNTLTNPGTSAPVVGGTVTIRLNTSAFTVDGTTEKVRSRTVTTNNSGVWSVTLEVNDDLDPAGTYYTAKEPGVPNLWTFALTGAQANLTVPLRSVLVTPPNSTDSLTTVIDAGGVDPATSSTALITVIDGGASA